MNSIVGNASNHDRIINSRQRLWQIKIIWTANTWKNRWIIAAGYLVKRKKNQQQSYRTCYHLYFSKASLMRLTNASSETNIEANMPCYFHQDTIFVWSVPLFATREFKTGGISRDLDMQGIYWSFSGTGGRDKFVLQILLIYIWKVLSLYS